jgi:hypothetical protein
VCNEYSVTVNGVKYADWYLPSETELYLLYLQRNVVGSFSSGEYWSSTESNLMFAWVQDMGSGIQTSEFKTDVHYVRAIRAF